LVLSFFFSYFATFFHFRLSNQKGISKSKGRLLLNASTLQRSAESAPIIVPKDESLEIYSTKHNQFIAQNIISLLHKTLSVYSTKYCQFVAQNIINL
jgi:hypothetical protein